MDKYEKLIVQAFLILAFAISIGMTSVTLSSVKSNVNMSFVEVNQTMGNSLTAVRTFSLVIQPVALILIGVFIIMLVWDFRRVK